MHQQVDLCKSLLSVPAFRSCQNLVDKNSFTEACVKDMCYSNSTNLSNLCSTITQYSHQCAHAGGNPQSWKNEQLCGKIPELSLRTLCLFQSASLFLICPSVCVGGGKDKSAPSTWSTKNAALLVLTPAAILRGAKSVRINAWTDASVPTVGFHIREPAEKHYILHINIVFWWVFMHFILSHQFKCAVHLLSSCTLEAVQGCSLNVGRYRCLETDKRKKTDTIEQPFTFPAACVEQR